MPKGLYRLDYKIKCKDCKHSKVPRDNTNVIRCDAHKNTFEQVEWKACHYFVPKT